MAIRLHMRPRQPPLTWEAFCQQSPPFSIALDGYVAAGPRFDPDGPRLNLNHHEEVDRLATRATCAQVLLALRQGLDECFCEMDEFRAEVFVNDCDEDVCLSWFLLNHAKLAEQAVNPMLNRLVYMVDVMDTTGGAYPFPVHLPIMRQLTWIFYPFRQFRQSGRLDNRQPEAFTQVLIEVEQRIVAHLMDAGDEIELDCRYERIGGGTRWSMIREIGSQGRTGAFADGIRAYVAVHDRGAGRWTYTVARLSPFVPFNVPGILAALNDAEGNPDESWGGGNTIGGSPRNRGSQLSPAEVEHIINHYLASRKKSGA